MVKSKSKSLTFALKPENPLSNNESKYKPRSEKLGDEDDGVDEAYGMLYILEDEDEEKLDRAEGVPYAYVKRELDIELVTKEGGVGQGEIVNALVYVDEKRLGEGVCKEEYVARMNRGIRDAVGKGMEREYVEKVLRRFVREEEVNGVVVDPFHPEKVGDVGYEESEGL